MHPESQIGVAVIDVAGLIMDDPNEQLDEEMAQMFGNAVAIGGNDDNDILAGDYVINAVDHASEETMYFDVDVSANVDLDE